MYYYCSLFSGSVNINCNNGQFTCQEANFYCPEEADCNINCDVADSCYNTNFYIESEKSVSLNLNCNSAINDACDLSDIQCVGDGSSTTMIYDSTNSLWICQDFDCCPLREGIIDCSAGSPCTVCDSP